MNGEGCRKSGYRGSFQVLFNTFLRETGEPSMYVYLCDQKVVLFSVPTTGKDERLNLNENSLVIFYLFFYEITSKAFS